MLAFKTEICTLDNMIPEWRILSRGKVAIIEDFMSEPKPGVSRDEYKKKLYKAVRISGNGIDLVVESITAAAEWLGVNQPSVSKAIKDGYRVTCRRDGLLYKVVKE